MLSWEHRSRLKIMLIENVTLFKQCALTCFGFSKECFEYQQHMFWLIKTTILMHLLSEGLVGQFLWKAEKIVKPVLQNCIHIAPQLKFPQ